MNNQHIIEAFELLIEKTSDDTILAELKYIINQLKENETFHLAFYSKLGTDQDSYKILSIHDFK